MKSILSITIILLSMAGCSNEAKKEDTSAGPVLANTVAFNDAQMKNAGIVTGKITKQQISSLLKVNGKIDVPPQNMVSISVPLGGYLKSTHLLPGMHINRGEVLAVMEDQQYIQLQQDFLTAKARISYLENEYNRQKELNQSKAASDKVAQQAEADYHSQRVLITSLGEKLKLAGINIDKISETSISRSVNIYSPISGFVSRVNVNIGKYVSPTEVLFELVNPSDIHLALKVYEKDLDKLYIGQKLVAYTNNQPDKKHRCEILLIGKDLSSDRNTDVHCHFETYDKTLVPGTYMNAEIEVTNNNAFVLPADALVRFEGKQFVFRAKGKNQFDMMEVTAGESENGFTEILNPDPGGLSNAEFVTKGAYSLLMSLKNKAE
jgi:membrane fusion protein, heavy metal efflux system